MSADQAARCWACGADDLTSHEDGGPGPHVRCERCGLRFTPQRTPEELRALYDAAYFEDYGGTNAAYEADLDRRRYESAQRLALVRAHAHAPGGALLEVGSAGGLFLDAARRAGFAARGIEPGAEMAERARRELGVDVQTGYLADFPPAPGSLDVVCAWHVLEHIPEPFEAMRTLRAGLRSGGVIALEVPNADSLQARRLGPAWPHWDPAHHVAHYTPAALRALLERSGFALLDLHTFPGTGYYTPRQALAPEQVAFALVEAARLRAVPRRPHPYKHELLRAVAQAGGAPAA